MPLWGKSSEEGKRKAKKGCGHSSDQRPSASLQVSHSQTFSMSSSSQPIPPRGGHPKATQLIDSKLGRPNRTGHQRVCLPSMLLCSFSKFEHIVDVGDDKYSDIEYVTPPAATYNSSVCEGQNHRNLLTNQAIRCETTKKNATNAPSSSLKLNEKSAMDKKQNSRELNNQSVSMSPKLQTRDKTVFKKQSPPNSASLGAQNSPRLSPVVTPRRVLNHEPEGKSGYISIKSHGNTPLLSSGHRLTQGSGHISGPGCAGGDVPEVIHRQHGRPGSKRFITLSPIMESAGPSSSVNSDAITPLHQCVAGPSLEDQIIWPADRKKQIYTLPIPQETVSNPVPTSPLYSSPIKPDNLPSAGSIWKKGRLLGCGTFGHVYLGFNNESGEMCAMKEVTLHSDDPRSKECAQQLSQEIALLSQLHHPNIVQYYGSEEVDENVYIYLEYVSGGSIHKVLHEYGPLGEAAVRSFTKQILSGLAYLHAKKTAHRDVKGANILLQPGGLVKLADFGMAKHITGAIGPMSFKGSPYWIAPEVVMNSNADVSVDIWSLGCTVLEMATGKPPWGQYEGVAALFKIGHSNEIPPIPESLSEECKDFIRKCLQRDPLQRPTAAMLLEHQFMNPLTPPIGNLSPQSPSPRYTSATRLPPPILIPNEASGSPIPTSSDIGAIQFQNPLTPKHMSAILSTTSIATPPGTPSSAAGNVISYHHQSLRHRHERLPPSLGSSPSATSGPSEHLAGGNMSLPFHTKSPTKNMHEDPVPMLRPHNSSSSSANTSYQDVKPDMFQEVPLTPITPEVITMHSPPVRRYQIGSNVPESESANRVSQQRVKEHVKFKTL